MGYIYKVTNKETGKVYIGRTKNPVKWRWHMHLYSSFTPTVSDYKTPLHEAIRKYGIDTFDVSVVETCETKRLDERETYWISRYKATDPDVGYNVYSGGRSGTIYTTEEIVALWKAGYAASEIAALIPKPIARGTVVRRLMEAGISQEEIRLRGNAAISRSKHKLIYQYSLDGKYIQSFYSAGVAGKMLDTTSTNINQAANGAIKSAGGYLWSYEKKDSLPPVKRNSGFTLVGKYSEDGKLVEAYTSITSAANVNGISRKRLAIACDKEEFYRGFKWKFLDIEGGIIHV